MDQANKFAAIGSRNRHLMGQAALINHRNQFWDNKFAEHKFDRHRDHFRHRHHGFFGSVFWPYAYGDVFSYAIWPYDYYYDPFWDYGLNTVFWNALWPYGGGGYAVNDLAEAPYDIYAGYRIAQRNDTLPAPGGEQAVADACQGFAPGVTDLPVQRFERVVKPTDEQRPLLADLRTASTEAAKIMASSCPAEIPLTPVGRLDAMTQRLTAMEKAMNIIREPLERFYASLNDQQKRRLDKVAASARRGKADEALPCSAEGVADVPVPDIEKRLNLDEKQREVLAKLQSVSAKAGEAMKGSCPTSVPASPAGRLDAMQKRVAALLQAIDTVHPAVSEFYASLNDEQKARFNISEFAPTKPRRAASE